MRLGNLHLLERRTEGNYTSTILLSYKENLEVELVNEWPYLLREFLGWTKYNWFTFHPALLKIEAMRAWANNVDITIVLLGLGLRASFSHETAEMEQTLDRMWAEVEAEMERVEFLEEALEELWAATSREQRKQLPTNLVAKITALLTKEE